MKDPIALYIDGCMIQIDNGSAIASLTPDLSERNSGNHYVLTQKIES